VTHQINETFTERLHIQTDLYAYPEGGGNHNFVRKIVYSSPGIANKGAIARYTDRNTAQGSRPSITFTHRVCDSPFGPGKTVHNCTRDFTCPSVHSDTHRPPLTGRNARNADILGATCLPAPPSRVFPCPRLVFFMPALGVHKALHRTSR
jgi:hypothetical protein